MKSYTNKNPEFTENFEIMEPTDTNHADNVNATTQPLIDNTLFLKKQQEEMQESLKDNETFSLDEKEKLSGIEKGANKTVVDSELSEESENPVQNKVVDAALKSLGAAVIISDTAPDRTENVLWVKPGGST